MAAQSEQVKAIWKVFWILLILTAIEFVIAFTMSAGLPKTSIFVIMTLVKAYFIVGEFMHLKHEVKSLIYTIVLPCVFVVWLIVSLLYEGDSVNDYRYKDINPVSAKK